MVYHEYLKGERNSPWYTTTPIVLLWNGLLQATLQSRHQTNWVHHVVKVLYLFEEHDDAIMRVRNIELSVWRCSIYSKVLRNNARSKYWTEHAQMRSSMIGSLDLSKESEKDGSCFLVRERFVKFLNGKKIKKTELKLYFKKREQFGRRFWSFPAAVQADSETFGQ